MLPPSPLLTTLTSIRNVRPVRRVRLFSSYPVSAGASSRALAFRRAAFVVAAIAGSAVALQTHRAVRLDGRIESIPSAPHVSLQESCIDPDTGIEFPKTLIVPSRVRLPPLSLVGLGVRKISFLGIKVYSVAFYADLSKPGLNIPADATLDEKIGYLISNTTCALRIIPTRNTSFSHLRDGFVRALQARISSQLKSKSLSLDEAEDIQSPLRKFKSMFPSSQISKGDSLDILVLEPAKDSKQQRVLIVRDLGSVESNWLAKEFVMTYFVGEGPSPPLKKSVAAFLQNYLDE